MLDSQGGGGDWRPDCQGLRALGPLLKENGSCTITAHLTARDMCFRCTNTVVLTSTQKVFIPWLGLASFVLSLIVLFLCWDRPADYKQKNNPSHCDCI